MAEAASIYTAWPCRRSEMISLQYLCAALADDHAWRHRVAGRDPRHDRSVGDAQPVDPVDFERTVDDGHVVSPHLSRAGVVPVWRRGVADEILHLGLPKRAWHDLAFHEGAHGGGIADLPAEFNAAHRRLPI